ncbi:MAG: winged helix-turn-helix domain-containing protein [Edaphobacter sp.]|uniref:winged helix-turn-helix domain-containing protein n=1 Tax=Edaphobacter sp. TaxID=1934404 RepID=UPI0023A1D27A|nr:winged helix-turn-helix domain-containing protein [Edaphobacter sp.]MDE1176380.1 winged helix-turn-helix domain-containing protein [Edaphobacter sp.]
MAGFEQTNRVAFERFEADLQTGELWKDAFRIRLPAQPFKVLVALLENAGEVVSKEELQERVWGRETNVDFERAIAGAINKIRDALGDSADTPHYIETLPKRGYRFLVPITVVSRTPRAALAGKETDFAEPATKQDRAPDSQVQGEDAPLLPTPALGRNSFRILSLAACGFAGVLLVAVVLLLVRPQIRSIPQVDQLTHGSPISEGPPNPENLPTLVTDGVSIFATARIDDKPQLASISIATGYIQRVPVPEDLASVSIADISKDGTRLLVFSRLNSNAEQPLWVVPTSGGSAFRVGNIQAHAATWMPDGKSILYAAGNDLFSARVDDGGSAHVMSLPGRAFWLRWSPDGELLRFTMFDAVAHTSTLWEAASGSHSAHPLSGVKGYGNPMCCGIWTEGGTFLFQMYRERGSDLWSLSRSFGHETLMRLTHGPEHYFSPVPARSGNRIFFLGSDEPAGLQRYDTGQHAFLSSSSFLWNATRVEYSPEGRAVLWTDQDGGLWRARASDGSDRLQLAPPQYEVFAAHWSQDGTQIAVMARRQGLPWSIYLVSARGGEFVPLLNRDHNAADPSWSSDGKKIAFGCEPDLMGKESGSRQVFVLDVQTKRVTALPGSEGFFSPRWSPDGKWIVALSLDQRRVLLFDWASQTWRVLAETSAADPVWARDSKAIYVHAFQKDRQPILKLDIPSGEEQVIADLSNVKFKDAENYFFSGLTPTNEPLILPRVGTSNLYTLDLDH